MAGDQRVFRALVEEAGAAWAEDVHELLELAKAHGRARARAEPRAGGWPRRSSPAPAATRRSPPTSARGSGSRCRRSRRRRPTRLRELLPDAATVGNPLDYTALIWGEVETLRDIVVAVGDDPSIDQMLVFYDQPADRRRAGGVWAAVREGIRAGRGRAARCP